MDAHSSYQLSSFPWAELGGEGYATCDGESVESCQALTMDEGASDPLGFLSADRKIFDTEGSISSHDLGEGVLCL